MKMALKRLPSFSIRGFGDRGFNSPLCIMCSSFFNQMLRILIFWRIGRSNLPTMAALCTVLLIERML